MTVLKSSTTEIPKRFSRYVATNQPASSQLPTPNTLLLPLLLLAFFCFLSCFVQILICIYNLYIIESKQTQASYYTVVLKISENIQGVSANHNSCCFFGERHGALWILRAPIRSQEVLLGWPERLSSRHAQTACERNSRNSNTRAAARQGAGEVGKGGDFAWSGCSMADYVGYFFVSQRSKFWPHAVYFGRRENRGVPW